MEELLAAMSEGGEDAWVGRMPRQSGARECRYVHLLAGRPASDPETPDLRAADPVRRRIDADDERFEALERQIRRLQEELAELRRDYQEFKRILE